MKKEVNSEAKLTFLEASGIIVGHGVGAGIFTVPYLASRNSIWEILGVVAVIYCINLILHLMIAELSYNNGGAQFVKCFENELFKKDGPFKKIGIALVFVALAFSVYSNVCSYITGAGEVLLTWISWPDWIPEAFRRPVAMLIFYVIAAFVVYFGLKVVGVCEKYSVMGMIIVVGVLLAATVKNGINPLPTEHVAATNVIALASSVSFALSAVMSTPQVVKGTGGNMKKTFGAIAVGTAINLGLIIIVTLTTFWGVGKGIDKRGAIVNLSEKLGGWVGILGFIFTLLAFGTSFWANTLNMRDIFAEQTKLNKKFCWFIASLPPLVIALLSVSDFINLSRIAGVIQVVTGIGIIVAYSRSRKKAGESPLCGRFGTLPFRIIVCLCSILATIGAVLTVK